ncbi:unnamed protein product [Rotaria socialis]|nr:unnamed protein product [Rotaria socialis]
MHGRSPILPFDQQQPLITLSQDPEHRLKLNQYLSTLTEQAKIKILEQQEKYKQRYDQHRSNPTHTIGELVLIKILNMRNKFDVRYEGPFRITQKLSTKTFIVQHVKIPTLMKQVTSDIMMSITQRRNIKSK